MIKVPEVVVQGAGMAMVYEGRDLVKSVETKNMVLDVFKEVAFHGVSERTFFDVECKVGKGTGATTADMTALVDMFPLANWPSHKNVVGGPATRTDVGWTADCTLEFKWPSGTFDAPITEYGLNHEFHNGVVKDRQITTRVVLDTPLSLTSNQYLIIRYTLRVTMIEPTDYYDFVITDAITGDRTLNRAKLQFGNMDGNVFADLINVYGCDWNAQRKHEIAYRGFAWDDVDVVKPLTFMADDTNGYLIATSVLDYDEGNYERGITGVDTNNKLWGIVFYQPIMKNANRRLVLSLVRAGRNLPPDPMTPPDPGPVRFKPIGDFRMLRIPEWKYTVEVPGPREFLIEPLVNTIALQYHDGTDRFITSFMTGGGPNVVIQYRITSYRVTNDSRITCSARIGQWIDIAPGSKITLTPQAIVNPGTGVLFNLAFREKANTLNTITNRVDLRRPD